MPHKIFCIGLSKTGTTSLHAALIRLGFTSVHYPMTLEQIDGCDAASDIPVASDFENLDNIYPGSKFIFTVRSLEEWLKSCENHFNHSSIDTFSLEVKNFYLEQRLKTYNSTIYIPLLFQQAYQKHEERVLKYFAKRTKDLLTLNITNGEGWEKLCSFLGCPIPNEPFPHENMDNFPLQKL